MSFAKSAATIGFYTLISRVLGFLRDVTIASAIGASMLADAFFVAFKIPNFLRRLFAEGAFNAAFVPMFAGMLAVEGQEKARAFADEALSFLIAVLMVISAACIIGMPWLMPLLAPGFSGEKFALTVSLTRITMPYIIFISVVSLLGGMLNSFHRFAAVAATPIVMNLCLLIIPTLILPYVPTFAHALSVAVFMAGLTQMLWLVYFCRKLGILPRLKMPRLSQEIVKLFKLIAPAALGAGVAQINLFIDLIIASFLTSAVSYLYYADRINELPLAVIGIAVGTVLLPTLSRQVRSGKLEEAIYSLNRAIEIGLLLSLPAAAALMVMAEPIVRTLYERGEFGIAESLQTAPALVAFAAGLPAFVMVKVLAPGFYANQDTKTPFKIASFCVVVNLCLNLALMGPLKHVGMALATGIAGWLNVFLMARTLYKRKLFIPDAMLLRRLPRMFLSTLVMSFPLWAILPSVTHYWGMPFISKITALSGLVATGLFVFSVSATLSHAVDRRQLRNLLKRKKIEE